MKKLVQRIISMGADFSTRNALKSTLGFLGVKPENIDRLYMELKNDFYRDTFKRISPRQKMVFLPQCLRNPNCKAVVSRTGYQCTGCSNRDRCKVYKIKARAESLGYRVFISPGGSMVLNMVRKLQPRAILGIACMKEIIIAMESLGVPGQAVELTRDGCVNTDVNLKEVFSIL